ncbi:MAG TPA: hypothetical protein PK453_12740 [Leptospiraceae bacterium]|nr:hypothetical protein [Leptospiraceae bacterium]HMY66153.1 hypothetical protein [Leptospiraceae bacterium]HNF14531.1 hypothetical protein [Leptospiraceae bacterium]HNF23511.1 hypothetical protein [Leptospiraceae bacterium]HNH10313.1 hypothetical protein [Leptospiraceae bacterium]
MKFVNLFLILFFFLQTCRQNDVKDRKTVFDSVSLELKISDTHKNYFTDALKNVYTGDEIKTFLNAMEEKSNPVCEMSWGKKKYDANVLHSFLRKENFTKPPFSDFSKPGELLAKLISGCWNFFLMNDEFPQNDFEKLKSFYPNERKKCYSVAFMQPYIMHSIVGCETLTFIDTDWKVLHAHRQMIEKFQQNRFTSEEEAKKALSEIKLSWLGNINPPRAEEKIVNLDTFCKNQNAICLKSLLDFQKKFKDLKSVDFRLTYLHELDFTKDPGTVSMFYMSNAIDPMYTNPSQFKSFLDRIKGFLGPEEKLVLMYHSGARPLYGIYELKNSGKEKLDIEAKCRDRYLDPPTVQNQGYYYTKLDYYLTAKKGPPYCSARQVDKPKS